MSNTAVLATDMAILVAIFALGLLAKLYPRKAANKDGDTKHSGR